MTLGQLVPVDRGNREAGIAAVRTATKVVQQGINMTIYVEGKRSFDGKLLPFKKGPFYLAMECKVPVVPVTISGSYHVLPKKRFSIKPGEVKVIFHDPIYPENFTGREALMEQVRRAIDSGLPEELQERSPAIEPFGYQPDGDAFPA
jgi:1-acyl-sn-glycerol-3-phosphate acyltransferase